MRSIRASCLALAAVAALALAAPLAAAHHTLAVDTAPCDSAGGVGFQNVVGPFPPPEGWQGNVIAAGDVKVNLAGQGGCVQWCVFVQPPALPEGCLWHPPAGPSEPTLTEGQA